MGIVLLSLAKTIGLIVEVDDDGTLIVQGIHKERSLEEWLRDNLPEGSVFSIDSFEVEGDEARAKVTVRLPPGGERVDIKINDVPLPTDG